jgi:hypothetical protein
MKNIGLGPRQELTTYRKIAIASWRHPRDPSTYSSLDLPAEAALAFLESWPGTPRPTLTHFVAKVAAHCLGQYPELNHVLRGGNLYRRNQTDVFITTLLRTPRGKDLSGFIVRDVSAKSLAEVAALCAEGAERLRRNEDPEVNRIQQLVGRLPTWLLRPLLLVQEFLQYTLNVSLGFSGLPRDQFGSVMITNIGALGIDNAFIPLSPYSRCPVIIGIGRPREMPVVKDGAVAVSTCVTVTFTFDHRHADGAHGAHLLRRFQKVFANPAGFRRIFEAGAADSPATGDE